MPARYAFATLSTLLLALSSSSAGQAIAADNQALVGPSPGPLENQSSRGNACKNPATLEKPRQSAAGRIPAGRDLSCATVCSAIICPTLPCTRPTDGPRWWSAWWPACRARATWAR
ncbi:MAG: hypothetical protein MZV65_44025 [Chromatiales bacterium]|nr:hypothetical protein [Chromatiales bacterium]